MVVALVVVVVALVVVVVVVCSVVVVSLVVVVVSLVVVVVSEVVVVSVLVSELLSAADDEPLSPSDLPKTTSIIITAAITSTAAIIAIMILPFLDIICTFKISFLHYTTNIGDCQTGAGHKNSCTGISLVQLLFVKRSSILTGCRL